MGATGAADTAFDDLVDRYAEPGRAYHALPHILQCLSELYTAHHLLHRPDEAEAAVWYHDAIYDPRAADNESRSADLADAVLGRAGVVAARREEIRRLILATTHRTAPAADDDAAIVVDADLSILGADRAIFDAYEQGIRREYAFVPEAAFIEGRRKILDAFLARPSIYSTAFFRDRYEERARANLAGVR